MYNGKKIQRLTLAAMMAAIIAVATAFIKIQTGTNNGYIHIGDSFIYLASCILPAPYAVCSAAIGGAIADLFAGAVNWAPATAIIKALNVLPFIAVIKLFPKKQTIINIPTIFASVLSSFITIFGYYFAEGILYGFTAAAVSTFIGLLQPAGSFAVFVLIGIAIDKSGLTDKIKYMR